MREYLDGSFGFEPLAENTGYPVVRKLHIGSVSIKHLERRPGEEAEAMIYLTWPTSFDTQEAECLLFGRNIQCAAFLVMMPETADLYQGHRNEKKLSVAIHRLTFTKS